MAEGERRLLRTGGSYVSIPEVTIDDWRDGEWHRMTIPSIGLSASGETFTAAEAQMADLLMSLADDARALTGVGTNVSHIKDFAALCERVDERHGAWLRSLEQR